MLLTIFFQQLRFIIGQLIYDAAFLLTEDAVTDSSDGNLLIRAARRTKLEDTDSKICRSSSLIYPFHRRHGGGFTVELK